MSRTCPAGTLAKVWPSSTPTPCALLLFNSQNPKNSCSTLGSSLCTRFRPGPRGASGTYSRVRRTRSHCDPDHAEHTALLQTQRVHVRIPRLPFFTALLSLPSRCQLSFAPLPASMAPRAMCWPSHAATGTGCTRASLCCTRTFIWVPVQSACLSSRPLALSAACTPARRRLCQSRSSWRRPASRCSSGSHVSAEAS